MNYKACLLALFVVMTWGINFSIIKIGIGEIPSLAFLALRFAGTALVFLPFIKWPDRKTILDLFIIGILVGVLHQGFMFVGLEMIEASTMSILLQSQVLMSVVIGWAFLKEKVGYKTWTGVFIGFVGILILFGGPNLSGNLLGYVYGILSALFLALAFLKMKNLQDIHPATFIGLFNLTTAPLIIGISLLHDGYTWVNQLSGVNYLFLGGALMFQIFVLSGSQIIWQKLLARYPISQVVPWFLLIPVFGILGGVFLLEEQLTTTIIIGTSVTILGLAIITLRKIQKNKPVESESFD